MAQYINKDVLVTEIEKIMEEPAPLHDPQCPWEDGYYCGLYKTECIIDNLEVKEVDLDGEIALWANAIPEIRLDDVERLATYFFELGLKAQKGE
jgi:hypothetical protein